MMDCTVCAGSFNLFAQPNDCAVARFFSFLKKYINLTTKVKCIQMDTFKYHLYSFIRVYKCLPWRIVRVRELATDEIGTAYSSSGSQI